MAGQDYLAIIRSDAQERAYWDSQPPASCPNDGTPLLIGPDSRPGILYCPMGDFEYPRDWHRSFSF